MKFKDRFNQEVIPNEFEFSTAPVTSSPEATTANIFLHGYSAWKNASDRNILCNFIDGSLKRDINIFCCWESGHYMTAIPTVTASKFSTFTLGTLALGLGKLGAFGPLGALAQSTGMISRWGWTVHCGIKFWNNFEASRLKAETMGPKFISAIKDHLTNNHPEIKRFNIAGHSLGSRLISHSLLSYSSASQNTWPQISDVMLMAGATDIAREEAHKIRSSIKGRLINVYSKSDRVLLANLGERSIGRRELEWAENVETNFGHSDYWPKINEVFAKTRFAQLNRPESSGGFSC